MNARITNRACEWRLAITSLDAVWNVQRRAWVLITSFRRFILCCAVCALGRLGSSIESVRALANATQFFRQRSQHTQWNCNVLRMDAIFGAQATCLNSSKCCVGDMRCTLNWMRRIRNNANHLNYFRDCSLCTVDFRRIVNHEDDSIVIVTTHPSMCFF